MANFYNAMQNALHLHTGRPDILSITDPHVEEANDLTTQIRHGSTLQSKIETAAAILGVNKSVFLR